MSKLHTRIQRGLAPAPRIAEKARQAAEAPSEGFDDAGLNDLAWFLDGNSGDIPKEVLDRLNGPGQFEANARH